MAESRTQLPGTPKPATLIKPAKVSKMSPATEVSKKAVGTKVAILKPVKVSKTTFITEVPKNAIPKKTATLRPAKISSIDTVKKVWKAKRYQNRAMNRVYRARYIARNTVRKWQVFVEGDPDTRKTLLDQAVAKIDMVESNKQSILKAELVRAKRLARATGAKERSTRGQ